MRGINPGALLLRLGMAFSIMSRPGLNYNYKTSSIWRDPIYHNSSGLPNSHVLSLRFGREFTLFDRGEYKAFFKRFFLKLEVGIVRIVSKSGRIGGSKGSWGNRNAQLPGDSMVAVHYMPQRITDCLGLSLSLGVCFRERVNLYLKGGFNHSFKPLYYSTVTHYSDGGKVVTATSTANGNFTFSDRRKLLCKKTSAK